MLKKLIDYFIHNSFIVNLLSGFLIIIGTVSLMSMKRDLIPQYKSDTIEINATLKGSSAGQIEKHITFPIEDAISSFAGVETIDSTSRANYSNINLKIKDGFKEVDDLFEKVKSSVDQIKTDLPSDTEEINVRRSTMTSFWFSSLAVMGLDENNEKHQAFLYSFVEKLRKLPGIVEAQHSFRSKNLFVKIDPQKVARYRLNIQEVKQKIKDKYQLLPLGLVERGGKEIGFEIENSPDHIEDLENLTINSNASGTIIKLKQIAKIEYRFDKRTRSRYTNGKKSTNIWLFKDLDTDTISLKEKLLKVMDQVREKAPANVEIHLTGDGPSFIERQLNVLNTNAIFGIFLVILTLYMFLGLKTALMTSLGIPLAYMATFFVLSSLGIKIDLISIIGMILILGILVDDAIIVSEQYIQFLELGYTRESAAYMAVKKTIAPITGTVITTIVAFLPILASNDGLSYLLRAIPWVVIAALGMSWIESFMILPNHLSHFVSSPPKEKNKAFTKKMQDGYVVILRKALKFRYPLLFLIIAFSGFSLWFASEKVPMKFNLRINSEKITIVSQLKKSHSLEETEKAIAPIWKMLEGIPKEKYSYLTGSVGRIWLNGKRHEGNEYAVINIRFSETHEDIAEDKEFVTNFVNKKLPALKTNQFEKLNVEIRKDGYDAAKDHTLTVTVLGNDSFNVSKIQKEIEQTTNKISGFKEVFIDEDRMIDNWNFELYENSLEKHGLSSTDLAIQMRGYLDKDNIHEFRFKGRNISIWAFTKDEDELDLNKLGDLEIVIGQGRIVPLSTFGTFKKEKTLSKISHHNLSKNVDIDVKYDKELTKKEVFQKDLSQKIKPLQEKYPHLEFQVVDADKEAADNKKSMNKKLIYSLLLILLVIAIVLKSLVQPIIIGSAIPFGVIGIIWAFYFHGQAIDVLGFVGIIGMAGVVVNDSLIMVDTVNHLGPLSKVKREEMIQACKTRLRPIILTSITTLGGVFPMAYGIGGDSGFTKPLALSMGWGLSFATLLTLFMIPAMLEIQKDLIKLALRLKNKFSKRPQGKSSQGPKNDINEGFDSAPVYMSPFQHVDRAPTERPTVQ